MTAEPRPVDAHAALGVRNSQPEGIGRVVALGDGTVAWNNLGRNVVFAGADLVPRAVFGQSMFDEDEPSQFDLDVHAILDVDGLDVVLVLNHYGTVRAFARTFDHLWTRQFVGDVERTVVVGDRLVGSGPREARRPGLLVSEPVRAGDAPLDVSAAREDFGLVTALARSGGADVVGGQGVVVGGERRVLLASVPDGGPIAPVWEIGVPFQPAFVAAHRGLVWAAGSETGAADDYDWEAQHGGGFVALDQRDGGVVLGGTFPHDLAWGNGGAALAVSGDRLYGVGRRGEVSCFAARDGAHVGTTAPLADQSLGIAHAAATRHGIVFGFNRGGYRLWSLGALRVGRGDT